MSTDGLRTSGAQILGITGTQANPQQRQISSRDVKNRSGAVNKDMDKSARQTGENIGNLLKNAFSQPKVVQYKVEPTNDTKPSVQDSKIKVDNHDIGYYQGKTVEELDAMLAELDKKDKQA